MSKHFTKKIKKVTRFCIDLLFPNLCFGCGKYGTLLCSFCASKIPLLHQQMCFRCQKNFTRYGELCFECSSYKNSLDAVFAATCYHVPIIKKMIHAFKYRFVQNFDQYLGNILLMAAEQSALPLPTHIIAVPLHKKRLRFRGFNQSSLLAEHLIQNTPGFSYNDNHSQLERTIFTKPQQKTADKKERIQNLKKAFQIKDVSNFQDAVIWLIDDVTTTNATLSECAKVLKAAGAKKVYGVVLAKD